MDTGSGHPANAKTIGPARPKHTEMLTAMHELQESVNQLERVITGLMSTDQELKSSDEDLVPSFDHVPLANASPMMIDKLSNTRARIDSFSDILRNDLLY